MTPVEDLRASVLRAHENFADAVKHLDDATLESEPACGTWPVREVAGHLAAWNLLILAWARAALDGTHDDLQPITDFDGFNAESARRTAAMSWDEVKSELDSTIHSAEQFISGITGTQLSLPAAYPWGGSGTVVDLLHGIDEHEQEHVDELRPWLDGRSRQ
jgi:hypothetical protein